MLELTIAQEQFFDRLFFDGPRTGVSPRRKRLVLVQIDEQTRELLRQEQDLLRTTAEHAKRLMDYRYEMYAYATLVQAEVKENENVGLRGDAGILARAV